MAIVINEEQQKSGGWFGIALLLLAVLIVGVAAYYVFFAQPSTINEVVPVKLQSLDAIQSLHFDPQTVVNSPLFGGQRQSISMPVSTSSGNIAPFGVL